jgi:hypothetical protein
MEGIQRRRVEGDEVSRGSNKKIETKRVQQVDACIQTRDSKMVL